jgi:hypothetical protein
MNGDTHNAVPGDLPARWRSHAATLRELGGGDLNVARIWELAAHELDESIRAQQDVTLNLREAARVSGYCAEHLSRLVKAGKIPNYGRRGAPRIRLRDLPRKSTGAPERLDTKAVDPTPEPDDAAPVRLSRSFTTRRTR